MRDLALIWHVHQPFFVPDGELEAQHVESYAPLLALHRELDVPFTLNVCGGLLERLATLAPGWVEAVREDAAAGRVELVASGKFHPMLPTMPHERARRQIEADVEAKRAILGARPRGFWPTDLGWAHWLVPLVAAQGVDWVAVDSAAAVEGSVRPSWREERVRGHRVLAPDLSPLVAARELGLVHRLTFGSEVVHALLRHHALSWDLVDTQRGALHRPERIGAFVDAVGAHYDSGADLLVLGDDGERVRPRTLESYRACLEALREAGVRFVLGSDAVDARRAGASERYLPAGTSLVDFSAWTTTPDDHVCLRQLGEVQERFVRLSQRAKASGAVEATARLEAIDAALLPCEDAALTFWKYLRRTREPFLVRLHALRDLLDEAEAALAACYGS